MSKRRRPRRNAPREVAGHGSFGFLPSPYPRESGVLVVARPDGTELRLHRTETGRREALEWREAVAHDGGRVWVGPGAGPLSAEEWIAAGRALAGAELPAASQST